MRRSQQCIHLNKTCRRRGSDSDSYACPLSPQMCGSPVVINTSWGLNHSFLAIYPVFFFFLFLPQPLCVQFKLAVEWQASPLDLKLAGTSVSTTFPLRAASEIHNARGGGGRPPSFPKRTVEEQAPPPPVICIRLLWETGERWLWA